MTSTQKNNAVTWEGVKFALAIIGPLLALAVAWGVMQAQIETLSLQVDKNQARIEQVDIASQDIKLKLAEISRDVSWIRTQVDKLSESNP